MPLLITKQITFILPSYSERALILLEPSVQLFSYRYQIRGMTRDDVNQELRWQLWRKFDRYHPGRASLRTWAWMVMRNRLRDMSRYRNDMLDHENRVAEFDEESDVPNENGAIRIAKAPYE